MINKNTKSSGECQEFIRETQISKTQCIVRRTLLEKFVS
jgi:hypothetical protein